MTDELRGCPFCGGDDLCFIPMSRDDDTFLEDGGFVRCHDCGGEGPGELKKKIALIGWSTRPAEARLRDALLDVWRVLGPSVPKSLNCCQGCDHEWGEALRIIKAALPGEVLPYDKGADDG